jgi:ABC-type sugar transport system substrate-binding protein
VKSARRLAFLAGVVLTTITVAACGSDNSSSTTSAAGTPADGSQTTAAANPCTTATKTVVDQARAEVPLKLPESALDLDKLKGKDVWMVLAAQTPFIQSIGKGFMKAATAAGMNGHLVSTPGDVTQMNEGISRAVAQNANGLSLMGVAPASVAGPLSKAVAKKIPYVDTFATGAPDEPLGDSFAHVTADYNRSGRVLADWAMADSGCKAQMALLSADGPFPNLKAMVPASVGEFKKQCPSDCKITTDYYDIGKIATELGSQTQSVLRRNPKTDYLFVVMDAGVQFAGAALQQAGAGDKVKVLGHDGVDQNLDDIRKGGAQDADMAFVPAEWIGWATVDELGRAILGEKAQDWTIPVRLIDSTNVGDSNTSIFPAYDGFEAKFQQAWKGSGS